MEKILVLMSSYNGEKYIEGQIISILNQTISECITLRIRDDGSSDKTVAIIKKIAQRYPDKIELIEGKNLGYNASFFNLINEAKGFDYYAISDQDDIWLPSKLEVAVKYLKKIPDDTPLLYASTSFLVHDDMVPYGQTRRKVRQFSIFNTIIQNICPGHTQVFNNALLRVIKDPNLDVGRIYVYDSWITNYAMLYGMIIFNNSSYTYYRQHEHNNLGSEFGIIGHMTTLLKRMNSGDGHKYRRQIEYFVERCKEDITRIGAYEELLCFINTDKYHFSLKFILRSKLYRQSKLESFLFKLGVLIGKY